MNPSKLYIENFMCHEKSYIDFTEFNSALVVGKIDNNDSYSNGVGKTSIFKAIEYVLFNQADVNLEKIIRDDTNSCQIVFDFFIGDKEYRISRKRTKKGATDLTLWQRTPVLGTTFEVYHTACGDGIYEPISDEKFWKDISGRRAADTEKELEKLIKINFKTFRSIVHFVQNDFSGLTTSTPEKRKALFKDALNLIIYSKLEKIAKDRANIILKDIDKHKILIESLVNSKDELQELQVQLLEIEEKIRTTNDSLIDPGNVLNTHNIELNELMIAYKDLENKSSSMIDKEKSVLLEKNKIELSIKDYQAKKVSTIKLAKNLIEEIKDSKKLLDNLNQIDFSQIEIIFSQINELKEKLAYLNVSIKNNILEYEELKIPVPDENICKHCRQPMTKEHKKICKDKIIQDMDKCQKNIASAKKETAILNSDINVLQIKLNSLNRSKQQLDDINSLILSKNKELQDKHSMHKEYSDLVDKFTIDFNTKSEELLLINKALENSSLSEANLVKEKIESCKKQISNINIFISSLHKELAHANNVKAVLKHNIDQKTKELLRIDLLKTKLLDLEKKYSIYPQVIQAFSSTGIPNLIIQNVLDDLQLKSNELLMQLKPGLQLSFFIEKTKNDGTEADTLDIHYHVNGKERYYEQLSGAMKLAVTFSLKIGLNSLLQEMVGTNIKFLLLDEIDQSLDKASVDSFANIVKFFQNDYTILIITHNDRLKDKFSHAILVQQDINMISKAKVVSDW